jgi:hypothetical protein
MFKLKLNKMVVICVSFRQEGHVRPVDVKSNLDSQFTKCKFLISKMSFNYKSGKRAVMYLCLVFL